MSRSLVSNLSVVLTLALGASIATAQPTPTPDDPSGPAAPQKPLTEDDLAKAQREDTRPWAKGVSPTEQQTALTLFKEGNALLRDQFFPKAVAKYREALGHWNHPAIYYNLALALVNLDQPLEIYDALQSAMEYGAAPLDAEKLDRAKSTMLLVEKQIGNVEYSLNVTGATLVFDGKEVFTGPGTYKARVRAGEHTVVARADGYTPVPLTVKLLGGTVSAITIPMYTDSELTRESRRMPNAVPYAVLGGGVVIAGLGALLHTSARSSFDDYDGAIKRCSDTDPSHGCSTLPSGVADMKTTAESRQTLAIAAYTVGGLAIASGIVLVIINRPHVYRIDPTKGSSDELSIAPVFTPSQAGFALSGSF